MITSRTRPLALLGDPVRQSLSPVLQNAACRAAGVDGAYVALRCGADELPGLIVGIARAGGAGNVTLPHKERAARIVERPSDAVRRTGACNTFWGEGGVIHGDNTDVEGFRRALEVSLPGPYVGMRVLLAGAGGAARAVLAALMDMGVREVAVVNRTLERATAMARRIGGDRVRVLASVADLARADYDLVVNSTSLGLRSDDPPPVDLDSLGSAGAVMDIVYARGGTRLIRTAEARGLPASDGRAMLLYQGAVAFERWWGMPAPVEAMQAALEEALSA